MRASCDLTEDYFLTSEVVVDIANGARVIPFVNPKNDNAVEAIVFTLGVNDGPASVAHLQRNLSVPSGWSYVQLDVSQTAPFPLDVAVAADATDVYLMVLADPDEGGPGAAWLTQLDTATGWNPGYIASYDNLGYLDLQISPDNTKWGPLKGGIDNGGKAYFYASATSSEKSLTYLLGWIAGSGWVNGNFNYQLLQIIDVTLASVTQYIVLFDTTGAANPVGYSLVLKSDSVLSGYAELAYQSQTTPQFVSPMTNVGSEGVTELIWAWASPGSTTGTPGYAVQAIVGPPTHFQQQTIFVDESGNDQVLSDQASIGANAVAVWNRDGLYTVNLLDPKGTLNTTAQYDDNGPTWGTAIPIGVGLTGIFGVPTDAHEATLFAVDPGGILNVLTRSATTGWTQNVVRQDAATTFEVVSWRCLLGLYDSSGAGVSTGSGSVQLSTSLPIDVWQDNEATPLLPGSPVTLTPNLSGEVTFSIPASELDTAELTATPLDANGKSNGPALSIMPNTDTHAFLSGTGSLSSVGGTTMTGSVLVNAQNKTWDSSSQRYVNLGPTMPALAAAGTTAAGQVAQAMNHVMALPAQQPTGGVQSALLDFTGSSPSFQTSSDPNHFNGSKTGETHWWEKAVHDLESAFHGLRHAAIAVKKMVTTWDNELGHWTINLVVDLADGIDHLMNWVVTGVEDAYHAVSSFFKALGSDIEHIWNWLKNVILSAIRDAGANAKVLEGWASTLVGEVITQVDALEHRADGFFTGLEEDVTTDLDTLHDQLVNELFGTHTGQPTASPGTGGDDSGSHFTGAQDVFHFLAHSPANWLMKKLLADIKPFEPGAVASIPYSNFAPAVNDLLNAIDTGVDTVEDAVSLMADLFSDAASSPSSFNAEKLTDLFNGFKSLTVDILTLLDDIVNALIDLLKAFIESFYDVITAEFPPPFIGEILRLAGIDDTPSILHLAALVVAYPATMLHALFAAAVGGAGQPMFPFGTTSASTQVGDSNSDWAGFGLGIASAVTQFVWATVDVGLDIAAAEFTTLPDKYEDEVAFYTGLDILCPFLLTILQWPVPTTYTGTQTPPPLHYDPYKNPDQWGNRADLLPWAVSTGIAPWLIEAIAFIVTFFDSAAGDKMNDNGVPIITTAVSITNTVLSAMYAYKNATTDGEKTLAIIPPVISNLSYVDGILGSKFAKSQLPGSAWFKFYIDLFGNYGTVFIDVGEAIAAAAK